MRELISLTVEMGQDPSEGFEERLRRLIGSKEALIRKALHTDLDLTNFKAAGRRVTFSWWTGPVEPEEERPFASFCTALCNFANTASRINASRSLEVRSEKYTFRVFLVRLGFIGSEHEETRRILLRRLSGNSAYSNWKKAEAVDPVQ